MASRGSSLVRSPVVVGLGIICLVLGWQLARLGPASVPEGAPTPPGAASSLAPTAAGKGAPSPGTVGVYQPHSAHAPWGLVQRIWLALRAPAQAPALLQAPPGAYAPDPACNVRLLFALRSRLLGQEVACDSDTRVVLDYLDAHPGLALEAVQTRLAFWCSAQRQARSLPAGASGTCPMDAASAYLNGPDGLRHCAHEAESSHVTFGKDASMMLMDNMSSMRTVDVDAFPRVAAYSSKTTVADIGAGVGAYTFPIAAAVAPAKVYATDIQPAAVDFLAFKAKRAGASNVIPVVNAATDVHLPASSIDLALIIDVPSTWTQPAEIFNAPFVASIERALRPRGRLLIVSPCAGAALFARHLTPYGFVLVRAEQQKLRDGQVVRDYVTFMRKSEAPRPPAAHLGASWP